MANELFNGSLYSECSLKSDYKHTKLSQLEAVDYYNAAIYVCGHTPWPPAGHTRISSSTSGWRRRTSTHKSTRCLYVQASGSCASVQTSRGQSHAYRYAPHTPNRHLLVAHSPFEPDLHNLEHSLLVSRTWASSLRVQQLQSTGSRSSVPIAQQQHDVA